MLKKEILMNGTVRHYKKGEILYKQNQLWHNSKSILIPGLIKLMIQKRGKKCFYTI